MVKELIKEKLNKRKERIMDKETKKREEELFLRQSLQCGGIDHLITCPHCGELIAQTISNKFGEIPLYEGDCVDCKFLDMLPKEEIIEYEDRKFIAMCGINGNVNPIHFTKKDLEDKKNWIAENFTIKVKTGSNPSKYRYYCGAFKKRDKKIDIDKL